MFLFASKYGLLKSSFELNGLIHLVILLWIQQHKLQKIKKKMNLDNIPHTTREMHFSKFKPKNGISVNN